MSISKTRLFISGFTASLLLGTVGHADSHGEGHAGDHPGRFIYDVSAGYQMKHFETSDHSFTGRMKSTPTPGFPADPTLPPTQNHIDYLPGAKITESVLHGYQVELGLHDTESLVNVSLNFFEGRSKKSHAMAPYEGFAMIDGGIKRPGGITFVYVHDKDLIYTSTRDMGQYGSEVDVPLSLLWGDRNILGLDFKNIRLGLDFEYIDQDNHHAIHNNHTDPVNNIYNDATENIETYILGPTIGLNHSYDFGHDLNLGLETILGVNYMLSKYHGGQYFKDYHAGGTDYIYDTTAKDTDERLSYRAKLKAELTKTLGPGLISISVNADYLSHMAVVDYLHINQYFGPNATPRPAQIGYSQHIYGAGFNIGYKMAF